MFFFSIMTFPRQYDAFLTCEFFFCQCLLSRLSTICLTDIFVPSLMESYSALLWLLAWTDLCLTFENKSAMKREDTKWQDGRDVWWQVCGLDCSLLAYCSYNFWVILFWRQLLRIWTYWPKYFLSCIFLVSKERKRLHPFVFILLNSGCCPSISNKVWCGMGRCRRSTISPVY